MAPSQLALWEKQYLLMEDHSRGERQLASGEGGAGKGQAPPLLRGTQGGHTPRAVSKPQELLDDALALQAAYKGWPLGQSAQRHADHQSATSIPHQHSMTGK